MRNTILALVAVMLVCGGSVRAAEAPPATKRPKNVPADAKKFGGHFYKAYKGGVSWDEAQKRCEKMGGYLACISSEEENAFLGRMVSGTSYYVGGRRGARGWQWVDGTAFGYTNWYPGEPNNARGTEDRLCLRRNKQWNDRKGGGVNGFICEWGRPPMTADDWLVLG